MEQSSSSKMKDVVIHHIKTEIKGYSQVEGDSLGEQIVMIKYDRRCKNQVRNGIQVQKNGKGCIIL